MNIEYYEAGSEAGFLCFIVHVDCSAMSPKSAIKHINFIILAEITTQSQNSRRPFE